MLSARDIVFYLICFTLCTTACDRDVMSAERTLIIQVEDVDGQPVEGAQIALYENEEDYVEDANAIANATTDSEGFVSFNASVLSQSDNYYFNVSKNQLRNWFSAISAKLENSIGGIHEVTTILDVIPQSFLDIVDNGPWLTCEFFFDGDQLYESCVSDDVLQFLKTGAALRFEGTTSCVSVQKIQMPLADRGRAIWTDWSISSDGSIIIRDSDPLWAMDPCSSSSGVVVGCFEAELIFNTNGTITIDYSDGGGMGTFRAILCPI